MIQQELKKDYKNYHMNSKKYNQIHQNISSIKEQCVFKCAPNLKLMINIEIKADLKRTEMANYLINSQLKN